MICSTLTALLLLSPQQTPNGETPKPGDAPATTPVANVGDIAVHAGMFPRSTLGIVSVAPIERHANALSRTGLAPLFGSILAGLTAEGSKTGKLVRLVDLGLTEEDVKAILGAGFSAGVTGVRGQSLQWLVVASLGGRMESVRQALAAHHASLETRGSKVHAEMVGKAKLWSLHHVERGIKLSYALVDDVLVVADSAKAVEQALARRGDSKAESLQMSEAYTRFSSRCREEGAPFLSALLQTQTALQTALAQVPGMFRKKIAAVTERLDLHKVSEVGMALFALDGELRDLTWIGYPRPRSGLLEALIDGTPGVTPELQKRVAADAVSVTMGSVNWQRIYREIQNLARTFDPDLPQKIKSTIHDLKATTGVDLEQDVLALIGGDIVAQEWAPAEPGEPGRWAVTVSVEDGWRLQKTLRSLAKRFRIDTTTVERKPAAIVPLGNGDSVTLVIHENHLILANSPVVARSMMNTLENGTGHPKVASELAALRNPAVSFAWMNCAGYSRQLMDRLSIQFGHREIGDEIAKIVEHRGGELLYTVEATDRGIAARTISPYGNLYLSLTAAFLLRTNLERPEKPRAKPVETVASELQIKHLREIVAAQHLFRDKARIDANRNGKGEFGTLAQVLDQGLVRNSTFEPTTNPEIFRDGKTLYRVHLPSDTAERETELVAFAWPANKATGDVYAVGRDGIVHRNVILAHAEGIASCDPRDFFINGRFGAHPAGGWEALEDSTDRKTLLTKPATGAMDSAERAAFSAIEKAEAENHAPAEVILLLESEMPLIAQRAAFAMGEVKCKEAVPQLCKMVMEHEDLDVQRHAMAALAKIRDPRSTRTAMESLASDDARVRAFAAQTLGALRTKKAAQKLVETLSVGGETDAPDRIAILVALADLGDPTALIQAATSCKEPGPKEQEALTFLFQELSHKAPNQVEAKTLIGVLNHPSELLRKFAIQRLGTLGLPSSAKALEGRLAKETTLQPLVRVSLSAVRGVAEGSGNSPTYMETAKAQATKLVGGVKRWWGSMSDVGRYASIGGGLLFLVGLIVWRRRSKRKRLQRETDAMVAMVAPSDDFVDPNDAERFGAAGGDAPVTDYSQDYPDYPTEKHDDEEVYFDTSEETSDDYEEVGADENPPRR